MGKLVVLSDRRGAASPSLAAFFFDLACPLSYLAAERVERVLGAVHWVPVPGSALSDRMSARSPLAATARGAAERLAWELRLPLVWPERHPADVPGALRAAAYAAGVGAGARFTLAAGRMAFSGGYDLEDRDVLAEVAAAAGLVPDACLEAAADASRDQGLVGTATGLRMRGVRATPAIQIAGVFRGAEAVFAERHFAPSA